MRRALGRRHRRLTGVLAAAVVVAAGAWGVPHGGPVLGELWDDARRAEPVPQQPADVVAEVNSLLAQVEVVDDIGRRAGYDRDCGRGGGCVFGPAWNDPQDHSGCDTRNRVLAQQLSDIQFKQGTRNCKVVAGWVIDPYTGQRIELADVQLDHIVPLARAYDAGAAEWDLATRQRFANDPNNLLAVTGSINASKSNSAPGQWLPPNPHARCGYVLRYLRVTVAYALPISAADDQAAAAACGIANQETVGPPETVWKGKS